nr:variable surface lipoprotein [Mycoplasmopsis bovis]
MKKSKFLLLGSVASLASIPFVAAKCGETKEEKKPERQKPEKKPGKINTEKVKQLEKVTTTRGKGNQLTAKITTTWKIKHAK